METFFLGLGFSFVWSKILPLICLFLIGFLVSALLWKYMKNKVFKMVLSFFLSIIPASVYFAIYPIYEGDIFDMSRKTYSTLSFPKERKLSVYALPNCPYCLESIDLLNDLVKRQSSKVKVSYMVLGSALEDSLKYRKLLHPAIELKRLGMDTSILFLTEGAYPTFVFSQNQKAVCAWDNNSFGAKAWDKIWK
jgi:hypothetical protein